MSVDDEEEKQDVVDATATADKGGDNSIEATTAGTTNVSNNANGGGGDDGGSAIDDNHDDNQTSSNSSSNNNVQNSFSADSPYFSSYVENEMKQMEIMNDTLKDIAARTKTMGKCGALMSESTRRLAMACRLRRPISTDDNNNNNNHNDNNRGVDVSEQERQQQEADVAARRRAIGEDMASLLAVMSEVRNVVSSVFCVVLRASVVCVCFCRGVLICSMTEVMNKSHLTYPPNLSFLGSNNVI